MALAMSVSLAIRSPFTSSIQGLLQRLLESFLVLFRHGILLVLKRTGVASPE